MKKIFACMLLVASVFGLSSCSEDKAQSKSMEQLYNENGVPVKVTKVKKGSFSSKLTYNAILTGKEESSAYAMVGDRVEKINAMVGDYVKKDQVLLTFPTDNPSAKYFQAKTAFENIEATYNRYKNIFETGGISKQQLDDIRTQYEVTKADWNAIQKMVRVLAPISGFVTQVAVRETDNVKEEQLLFTIADLSNLKATIKVAEDEIDQISVGSKASAVWKGNEIKGKVIQVDLSMNPRTQSFGAIVEFKNSDKKVKAGVTGKIIIEGIGNSDAISVARKDVLKETENYFVYLLEDGNAKKQIVKVGKSSGLFIEITDGLMEGNDLIVEGQLLLDDGKKVNVIN